MEKYLITFVISLMIFGCSKKIYTDEIENGQKLNSAISINETVFFELRMQNKLRKINVGNWDVLYESSSDIYICRPRLKSIFSNKRIVDTLYKIDRKKLITAFPKYNDLQGFMFRQKTYSAISAYYKDMGLKDQFYLQDNLKSELKENQIIIIASCANQSNEEKTNFRLTFDTHSLEIILFEKIN